MIDQKGEILESKFRLTYGTIFSLLLARDINVKELRYKSNITRWLKLCKGVLVSMEK